MNDEVLRMVEIVANEKDIPAEGIFTALESALSTAMSKRMKFHVQVVIDRDTGFYNILRHREVVANQDKPDQRLTATDVSDPAIHITLAEARKINDSVKIGDILEDEIAPTGLGRIAAQIAKQVILQKVREAERIQNAELYRDRLGQIINGVVVRTTRDQVILSVGDHAEAILLRDEMLPKEALRINDKVRAYLYKINTDGKGPQLMVSRPHNNMLVELFHLEVPEVGEEIIEIKAVARDCGIRAKIAVKTNDGRIDPIGACIGIRGSRVQAVSNELGGERVDVILWDDNPAQLVINAMSPAEMIAIVMDEEKHVMDISVDASKLSQAIGRNGQNVRLASELSGWTLNVMTVENMALKHEKEVANLSKIFIDNLGVDNDIATILVKEGFNNLEQIAYVAKEELLALEDFDEDIVSELQTRAKTALLQKEQESKFLQQVSDELLQIQGINDDLANQLARNGILTLDNLAEQSIDDLLEITSGLSREQAATLIMKAREPWFRNKG